MRRSSRPVRAALLLVLAGALGLTVVLGGTPARAGGLTQVSLTTAPPTSPGTTAPLVTTPRTVPGTTPKPATTRATATTVKVTTTTVAPKVAPVPVPAVITPTTRFVPPTTIPPTTTTIVGIRGQLPVAPATVPLHTTGSNGHVDPTFAWLSAIGFAIALALVGARLFVTRPGGRDRAPLV